MIAKVAGLALLGMMFSCGSDSNDAPAKCDALVARVCERWIACTNSSATQAECVAVQKTSLPCAQADAVSDGYNSCMSELQTSPCSVLAANNTINLPATCISSILFKQ
jgi:hypothetical protein